MAGCYGNSAEDRYYESKLYDYLESQENYDDEDEFEQKPNSEEDAPASKSRAKSILDLKDNFEDPSWDDSHSENLPERVT